MDVASTVGFVDVGVDETEALETRLALSIVSAITISTAERARSTDAIVTVIFLRLV